MTDVINGTVLFVLLNYLLMLLPILVLQSSCGCTADFAPLLPLRDSRALLSRTIEAGLETWTKIYSMEVKSLTKIGLHFAHDSKLLEHCILYQTSGGQLIYENTYINKICPKHFFNFAHTFLSFTRAHYSNNTEHHSAHEIQVYFSPDTSLLKAFGTASLPLWCASGWAYLYHLHSARAVLGINHT